jgi:exonuclease SbcC
MTNQGSEWHKWNLHFHTPASFDYHAKGLSFEDLAKAINSSTSEAFAITDHWTLDGYFKLKTLVSPDKLILPGMEVRIDKTSKQKGLDGSGVLQCIIIFPPNTTEESIKKNFLHRIQLCERENKYITKEDIIDVGKEALPTETEEEKLYEAGCGQSYVDYKEVIKAARGMGALVCLTYDKYGGFDSIDPVKDSIFKRNLVKDADSIRKDFYENEGIIKACGKRTPCFNGSDAHEIKDIERGGTWIKSEKSFEGLRQIIYFPKERVSFSTSKPLNTHPRIKEIVIQNNTAKYSLSSISKVPLSENLTAIIGHPSIGKSTFAEIIAFLFNTHTLVEPGEDKTKIGSITEIDSSIKITAEVLNGLVAYKISRELNGEYEGTISKDEFTITYLNQGFIDKTARDPEVVSELILKKMENAELETLWSSIEGIKSSLETNRNKNLGQFTLIRKREDTKAKLDKANKALEFSNSIEYKAITERNTNLEKTEKEIESLETILDSCLKNLTSYETELSGLTTAIENVKKYFPSIAVDKNLETPILLADRLEKLIKAIQSSEEKKKLVSDRKTLTTDMQKLLTKEGITITDKYIKQQITNKKIYEVELGNINKQIIEAQKEISLHSSNLKLLGGALKDWNTLDEKSIKSFNEGFKNITVRYEKPDIKNWLIKILTDEAKQAWEKFTPEQDKVQKFTKPSEDDIRKIIEKIQSDKKLTDEALIEHLVTSLENNTEPLECDFECVKWLFGDKSLVIKEFLKLRLKEVAQKGKHQIYYLEKNISREGLSFTERCGALLEIMIEKGNDPIILDQPEDNLGSSYITSILIKKLLDKKQNRQIILISHNPNTVVLSDADLIVAFDRKEKSEDIELKIGAIEDEEIRDAICNIIEGGKEAFEQRARRYKYSD